MSYLLPSPLPVANGGTGYNNSADAFANLLGGAVIAIENGGTGQTTKSGAIAAAGGMQTCTVSQTSVTVASIGTISGASWNSSSAVVTFTSASVTLVPGMCFSTTGLTTAVIKTVDSPTQITLNSNPSNTQSNVTVIVLNSTLTTMQVTGMTVVDGRTLQNGDLVLIVNQGVGPLRGPWVVSSAGSPASLTRPSWFTGTLSAPIQVAITEGGTFRHFVYVLGLPTNTATTQIGIEQINVFTSNIRASNATISANTFTGKQTLQAGSTGSGAVPFAFQAGSLMTTPQAHSVEWDGTNEYVSAGAQFAASISGTTMTVTGTPTGVIQVGMLISGTNVTAGTTITAVGTGAGGTGTYTVSASQTVSSTTITGTIRCIIGTFVNGAVGGSGAVPASSAAIGRPGQLAFDSTGLYVCTASNTWRKVALTTF